MAQSSESGDAATQSDIVGNVAFGIETEMHEWAKGSAPEVQAATKQLSTNLASSRMVVNSEIAGADRDVERAVELDRKGDKGGANAARYDAAEKRRGTAQIINDVHPRILKGNVDEVVAAAEASVVPAPSSDPATRALHRADIQRVAPGDVAGLVALAKLGDDALTGEVYSPWGIRHLTEGADAQMAKALTTGLKSQVVAGIVNAKGASDTTKAAGRLLTNQGKLYGMTDAHRTHQELKARR